MLISRIMRTNVDEKRLEHHIYASQLVSDINPEGIRDTQKPEVRDENEKKVGEMRTADLLYLIEASQRLHLSDILDKLDDGVIAVDAEGRICFENEAYSRIVGVSEPQDHWPKPACRRTRCHPLKGLGNRGADLPQPAADSFCREVCRHADLPHCKNGKIKGAYSIFQDVSEFDKLNQEFHRMAGIAREYGNQLNEKQSLSHLKIVRRSPVYDKVLDKALTIANTDASVLIRGESGVGKEVITRLIHENSHRSGKPLITVNCAAIPDSLIESELFGYEDGAFTGSRKGGKLGKFELAHEGRLFLDEIGDMPYAMQAKLLRALQEGRDRESRRQQEHLCRCADYRGDQSEPGGNDQSKTVQAGFVFPSQCGRHYGASAAGTKRGYHPLINHFLQKNNEKYKNIFQSHRKPTINLKRMNGRAT